MTVYKPGIGHENFILPVVCTRNFKAGVQKSGASGRRDHYILRCGSSVRSLLHISLPPTPILKWLLDIRKKLWDEIKKNTALYTDTEIQLIVILIDVLNSSLSLI